MQNKVEAVGPHGNEGQEKKAKKSYSLRHPFGSKKKEKQSHTAPLPTLPVSDDQEPSETVVAGKETAAVAGKETAAVTGEETQARGLREPPAPSVGLAVPLSADEGPQAPPPPEQAAPKKPKVAQRFGLAAVLVGALIAAPVVLAAMGIFSISMALLFGGPLALICGVLAVAALLVRRAANKAPPATAVANTDPAAPAVSADAGRPAPNVPASGFEPLVVMPAAGPPAPITKARDLGGPVPEVHLGRVPTGQLPKTVAQDRKTIEEGRAKRKAPTSAPAPH